MASSDRRKPPARHKHERSSLEFTVTWLMLLAGGPSSVILLYLMWTQEFSFEVRWTVVTIVAASWLGAAIVAGQAVTRVLNVIANLLGALREGDYSIRGLGAKPGSATDLVMIEVNALGETLYRQRVEAVESTKLLSAVMAEIDVAVFAFDPDERLVLVNPAGERLLGGPAERFLGRDAGEMGFTQYLTGDTPRLVSQVFTSDAGRFELRRSTFRKDGRVHHLVVFSDLRRALREQEQQAWQRIVRVLSHEINNSLTPIKSLAHSLRRIVDRAADLPRANEVQEGLTLIENRSGALGRFLRSYAQLARLPKPQRRAMDLSVLVRTTAELDSRVPIAIGETSEVPLFADPDQLEQLLINLVRNGVDAALETGGGVQIAMTTSDGWVEVAVEDEGRGLPDTTNLFVPFFTTKPNGSGIGLALSRQIAEAHGGTVTLENRKPGPGCRAVLKLPLSTAARA